MSTQIYVDATFAASPATTWSVVEQIEDHVAWMSDAQAITFATAQRAGTGTRFNCLTRIGPLQIMDSMTVTRWVPGEAMGVDHRGVVRGSGVFTLREMGDGRTRFSWEERLTFPWWLGGRVGERVAQPLLSRVWRGNLARLKRIVEAAPRDPSNGNMDTISSS